MMECHLLAEKQSTVSCYDSHAQAYDLYQSAVVPGYRDMLDLAACACRRYLPEKARILDLGCGTGNASLAILQQLPSARIFLLDGSPRMVQLAAEKLEQARPGSILGRRVADLSREGWQQGLAEEEGFDAIVSTLVLEHLPFSAYRAAIAGCLCLLRPGGWLLAAEGYSHEGSDMQEWFYQEMERRRQSLDPALSDFVARLTDGRYLIIEVKGELGDAEIKQGAALRWCAGVNRHGGFGAWSYHLLRHPADLMPLLDRMGLASSPEHVLKK